MTDDGKVKVNNPSGDGQDSIQMAVDACPTQAIVME
jgi:ferredoxin